MKTVDFAIDLGTTNSLIAKFENGRVTLFKNPVGHKETLASVVAFRKDRVIVGDKAREYLLKDPVNVFGAFKRRMGTDDEFYVVNIDDNVTPVELSAYVLKELKRFVRSGETVDAAVIAIPASFDTMQANATKKAGELAGFDKVFLLQEPVAACLAYFNGADATDKSGYRLAYDLGGGTFDVALVEIRDGEMKVVDHEGNNFLGGTDFDALIVEHAIAPQVAAETGEGDFFEQLTVKHGKHEKLLHELMYRAEEAKKELSAADSSEIEFSAEINGRARDFVVTLTAERFGELISGRVNETVDMLKAILERNGLQASDVAEIVLIGGSTFIPHVRNRLRESTGITVNAGTDPTSAVAVGAAYYAASKYYEPELKSLDRAIDDITASYGNPESEAPALTLDLSYNRTSREEEEVLLVKINGRFDGYSYRIARRDGGFDTGTAGAKAKFAEFLPLLRNVLNVFTLSIFDSRGNEIHALRQELKISHGQYNIQGQPLPRDICIEIDDKENSVTRLEVVFEKNSILPLKKTLYREISKTVRKDSDDSIIINILEGDRLARAASNLPVACIEISGRQLTSDLIKGSDIEICVTISDNRELSVETYLVMTRQEFKNIFSVSEKHVNVSRLREQCAVLEREIRSGLKQFSAEAGEVHAEHAGKLMRELERHSKKLSKLCENDVTDTRYVIAEAVSRISREFDKIGGSERLAFLTEEYFRSKEDVEHGLSAADMDKDSMKRQFGKILENESYVLRSRNPAALKRACDSLKALHNTIQMNTFSSIISTYYAVKNFAPDKFVNYNAARLIFDKADRTIDEERYPELKRLLVDVCRLLKQEPSVNGKTADFKGTGVG
ncbi:MAG: Hsp70 family protein [Prevotellaceae bacterium]|jgi:molecular chaperone DnaK|nr:Hsp70 family protein [Prevotellaceae bacterium]